MKRMIILALVWGAVACGCETAERGVAVTNPPAEGFLAAESDPHAVDLADSVMTRLGGRRAWDDTRFIRWNFFGARSHVWDRHTGRKRVEGTRREDGTSYVVLVDVHGDAKAWVDGEQVTDPDERASFRKMAHSAWVNDSYWLVMPYKLKDTGVRLRSTGEGTMIDGRVADIIELTFRETGETPDNKYLVYVARDTGLVEQWDFYRAADDAEPRFHIPWHDWRRYGAIMLSGDRGEQRLTDIGVYERLPDAVFEDPAGVEWGRYGE